MVAAAVVAATRAVPEATGTAALGQALPLITISKARATATTLAPWEALVREVPFDGPRATESSGQGGGGGASQRCSILNLLSIVDATCRL